MFPVKFTFVSCETCNNMLCCAWPPAKAKVPGSAYNCRLWWSELVYPHQTAQMALRIESSFFPFAPPLISNPFSPLLRLFCTTYKVCMWTTIELVLYEAWRVFQGEKDYAVVLKEGKLQEKMNCIAVSKGFSKVKEWDEPWDLKNVWEKSFAPTVPSFSFTEFFSSLVSVALLTLSDTFVVFLWNFLWGVSVVSSNFSTSFTILSSTLHAYFRVFNTKHVCCPVLHLTMMLLWSRLVAPGRSVGEIVYLCSLYVFGVTSSGFRTLGRCYLLCRAAEVAH